MRIHVCERNESNIGHKSEIGEISSLRVLVTCHLSENNFSGMEVMYDVCCYRQCTMYVTSALVSCDDMVFVGVKLTKTCSMLVDKSTHCSTMPQKMENRTSRLRVSLHTPHTHKQTYAPRTMSYKRVMITNSDYGEMLEHFESFAKRGCCQA